MERFSAPFQYALSTRAGSECIAHALQALSEKNPQCTVMSIDGIGAFDLIARKAMLEGLVGVAGGEQVLPFVKLFYGSPSEYMWEDENGTTQIIPPGRKGKKRCVDASLVRSWTTCRVGSSAGPIATG